MYLVIDNVTMKKLRVAYISIHRFRITWFVIVTPPLHLEEPSTVRIHEVTVDPLGKVLPLWIGTFHVISSGTILAVTVIVIIII